MGMFTRTRGPLVALASLAASAAPAAAAVDPGIVGYWELQGVVGRSPTLVEFHPDGTYVIHDAQNGQSGTFEAEKGAWSLASKTSAWRDRGTYSVDADVLTLAGIAGVGKWKRFRQSPFFTTTIVDGQQVPQNVGAALLFAWYEVARPWEADAIPVGALEVEQWRTGEFHLKMRFLSPSKRTGITVTESKFERSTFVHQGRVTWSDEPMPFEFVDLPRVVELFKGAGRRGPFTEFAFSDSNGSWGWSDTSGNNGRDVTWITAAGEVSHEAKSEYIEQYNANMEAAAQALSRFLAQRSRSTGIYAQYNCPQNDDECVAYEQFYESLTKTMCALHEQEARVCYE